MLTGHSYESADVRAVTGPAIRPGGLALTGRAADRCRLDRGDRVLDVGCGTGASAEFLAARYGVDVVGVDLSAKLIGEARRRHPGAVLVRGDAGRLPLSSACFHAVFCECVCSLVPDAGVALREIRRTLLPGGALVVADLYWRTPDAVIPCRPEGAVDCLGGAVDRRTMIRRITAAGFAIVSWEDHTDALKQLAAQLVWAGIPPATLWGASCAPAADAGGRRPGYCLIVARKN